jgi:hypothetical protein
VESRVIRYEQTGEWSGQTPGVNPLPLGFGVASDRLDAIGARIFDDRLRHLARAFQGQVIEGFLANGREETIKHMEAAVATHQELHNRANVLLKELF